MTAKLRSQRLATLVRLAAHAEQSAARDLASSQRELDAVESRLAQMRAARAEYLGGAASADGNFTQLAAMRRFLAQLDGVILQLEWQTQRRRGHQERQREVWAGKHARTQALDEVKARARQSERGLEIARAEREIDDRSGLKVSLQGKP